jgi:hypothetical protein
VARWLGGSVARWLGGSVARWLGGSVARWLGGSVARIENTRFRGLCLVLKELMNFRRFIKVFRLQAEGF